VSSAPSVDDINQYFHCTGLETVAKGKENIYTTLFTITW